MTHVSQSQHSQRSHRKPRINLAVGLTLGGLLFGSFLIGAYDSPSLSIAAISSPKALESTNHLNLPPAQGFAEIVKAVRPAVVNITASKIPTRDFQRAPFNSEPFGSRPNLHRRDFFGMPTPPDSQDPRGMGMGSGVLVSPNGYVVTNNHVVEGTDKVKVLLPDKREFIGTVIGTDPKSDIAVIKIDGKQLPYISWGDSSTLEVGDYVLAVGNPFGLNATVTQGIVSALGRGGMGITHYEDFIQTDAAINPGNSGGALVNMRGKLVGINTAILSRSGGYQGIGLAIPATMGMPIYESLVKTGTVERGYLGIGIQEMTSSLATALRLTKAEGALVTDVKPGSPAQQAGLKQGDVIISFHGTAVNTPRALQHAVTQTTVGTQTSLMIIRDGKRQELHTIIGEHPDTPPRVHASQSKDKGSLAGIAVANIDPRQFQRLGLPDHIQGVLVTAVQPGSQPEQSGLRQGDVIRAINRQPIRSIQEYEVVVSTLTEAQQALVLINRRGVSLFLSVTV
ncbi:MAG: Do family serine endopeptidase [Nitrospirales bacterium]|nr:Do family serine endopeptidase [Nitrospirales bacterium]